MRKENNVNCGDITSLVDFDPQNIYDQYASWTDTVAKYPPTAEPHYLALGIADELGELAGTSGNVNVLKEGGDVLWYCARYSTRVLGIAFSTMIDSVRYAPVTPSDRNVMASVGILCGVEKKRIRDGANWDNVTFTKKRRAARDALCDVLVWVHSELAKAGYTLSDAIDANQGKLNDRLEAGTIQGDGDNR